MSFWSNEFDKQCYMDGLVQDSSNSIANALELLQSCTKPSHYDIYTEHSYVLFFHIIRV